MEHLETDVMRFMAILAFCLVAVFALVQSVPHPAVQDPAAEVQEAVPVAAAPLPSAEAVPASPLPAPRTPAPASVIEPAPAPADPAPAPVATQAPPAAEPVASASGTPPEPTEPARTEQGFSLRFESDAALIGLVERREVVLYAFSGERVWRFMIVEGRPTFRTAAAPGQVHEMTASTVPGEVVSALRRSVVVPPGPVRWGVTLPPPTAAVVDRVVATGGGGELVIDSEGFLRLEGDS